MGILSEWLKSLREPDGFVLEREDGKRHNVIRGDLIPADTMVIIEDGRHFVNTGEQSDEFSGDWRLYREGHATHAYHSING